MQSQTKPLKPFPYSTTKKDLVTMYHNQMAESDIIRGINAIIQENRKLDRGRPVCVQRIWHIELAEFVEVYGVAKDYELPDNF